MAEHIHDSYGKTLLNSVVGSRFLDWGDDLKVLYKGNVSARIDGVIDNCCAVEIESRVNKQVRGALVDLLEHQFPKKLLIIIPAHMSNPKATAAHCLDILERYGKPGQVYATVVLRGTGRMPKEDVDTELIRSALKELEIPV